MKVRGKIVVFVFPLIVASLLITGMSAFHSARRGVTSVAARFLSFKAEALCGYAQSQWNLIEANGLAEDPAFREAAKAAVSAFGSSMIRSDTELVFAVDADGSVTMNTSELVFAPGERERLREIAGAARAGWETLAIGGVRRVAITAPFEPLGWQLFVSERRDVFYRDVDSIFLHTGLILGTTLALSALLLVLLAGYITRPLGDLVSVMRHIISSSDLSRKARVLYGDETGELAHTFNLMIGELEQTYEEMKDYAVQAVLAKHQEQKIRNIFQKYVPHDVIERFFRNPEAMLEGETRELAILFSDIRDFTSISERMASQEIVSSLNDYFEIMVDIIMGRGGVVDKYIGDAIMAFFGAPVEHGDDPLRAVGAALEMVGRLDSFNRGQEDRGRPTFRMGVGITFGPATVGNIGSERKMDYTVIGDMVNIASRLESLTKVYRQPILVSDAVHDRVGEVIPCRFVDRVVVKGRSGSSEIYAPGIDPTQRERDGWDAYHEGIDAYYRRRFEAAVACFAEAQRLMPGDHLSDLFASRARALIDAPPPEAWRGEILLQEK